MPSLFFDTQEIEETGTAKVDVKTGLAYIGRKHGDKEVIWIKLKECKNQEIMDKYLKQSPEENCKMFEELDKLKKGTWFYPMWAKSKKLAKEQGSGRVSKSHETPLSRADGA